MGAPSPSPDLESVTIGTVLDGRYRIDSVLGTGGMGRVYKGEHTGIGRAVAIKVLHAQLGRSKEATQRFQREALASGRLDHPNIVGVSDFGVLDDGSLYLVMEALEGEPLGKRLEREKRIPWPEALEIMRGVLAGLRHAHEKGVVHRDIKPDNIFLARKDGETIVKILDFGIAKLYAGNADDPATTRAGLTVGTPAYLSPEQAVGGAITPASDLYSSSVVLYEMLVGRAPFEDEDPLAMLTAHVSRDVPTFAEVAPDLQVPPGLEALIQRGLQKVSAERISKAVDYQQALDDILRTAGYTPANVRTTGPSPLATPPPGSLMTPPPGSLRTPFPGAMNPFTSEMGTAPTAHLPTPSLSLPTAGATVQLDRGATIADSPPIPRKWLVIAGVVVLAIAALAGVLLLSGGSDKGKDAPASAPVIVPVPTPLGPPVDRETVLRAALYDLENGKTCEERRAVIPRIAELGDASAIPALKRARYRMRGGVLGIGDSNTNACLRADAEAAIKDLGGTLR